METEKRTAEEIVSKNNINTAPAHWVTKKSAIKSCGDYAAQELAEYKARLRELIFKRKQDYHKDCLNDNFINGRFWEAQELLELIDKL